MPEAAYRDRIVGHKVVRVKDLVEHPLNFRKHPEKQAAALRGSLESVGVVRSPTVFVRPDGRYQLIDGHLRKDTYPPDMKIKVEVLDVTEAEANEILATIDPLASWAEHDGKAYRTLLKDLDVGDEHLAGLFSSMVDGEEELEIDVGDEDDAPVIDPTQVEESHVVMLQLFLDKTTNPLLRKYLQGLGPLVDADNPTDIVFKVTENAYKDAVKDGRIKVDGEKPAKKTKEEKSAKPPVDDDEDDDEDFVPLKKQAKIQDEEE